MSNDITGVIAKEVAVNIKALLVGAPGAKSPAPIKSVGPESATKDEGNTKKQPENPEKVKKAVQEAVEFFDKFARENQYDLKFSVDNKSNAVIVQLFEKGSGKMIRQIPSEEVLKLRQHISDLLGIIYDRKM